MKSLSYRVYTFSLEDKTKCVSIMLVPFSTFASSLREPVWPNTLQEIFSCLFNFRNSNECKWHLSQFVFSCLLDKVNHLFI